MTEARRKPFSALPTATQAGILCNDERFQTFVHRQIAPAPQKTGRATPAAAAEFSRSQLDTNATAAAKFQALRTDFDAWLGRIATYR